MDPSIEKRKNERVSEEKRSMIIRLIDSGKSIREVSNIMKVNYWTIRSIYLIWLKEGRVNQLPRGHRKPMLTDHQKEKLCDWLDEDCQQTLVELQRKFEDEFGIKPSVATIGRALKSFSYTLKRITPIPERRNSSDVKQIRYDYAMKFNSIRGDMQKIFFLDETGIQVFSRRNYGRAPRGMRACNVRGAIRSRNYSIEAVISIDKLYFFEIMNRPYNSEHFLEFLVKFLDVLEQNNVSGAHLIMDNVAFHRAATVNELIISHGHNPLFLPPYSPFLNPIENMFNQWKHWIKSERSENEDQLYANIHIASRSITAEHCANYFRNLEQYLFQSLMKEDIFD